MEKVTAIVLGRVRHNDRVDILSLYTDLHGRVAVSMPTGSSPSARRRTARTMPLAVVRGEMSFKPGRSVQTLRNPEPYLLNPAIYSDPVKGAIALFVCEFLTRALREAEGDERLFQFLTEALVTLNEARRPENFHLAFLSQISRFLGIVPDVSDYSEEAWFDMRAGAFTDFAPLHKDVIAPEQTHTVLMLWRLDFRHAERLRLSGTTRRAMISGMLRYFAIHIPGLEGMKTPDVLHDLFS